MLRASTEAANTPLDPRGITDASVDSLVEYGSQLIGFVDAVVGDGDLESARLSLDGAMGSAAVAETAGVIGNFVMMNRIAEGTGIPVGKGSLAQSEEWRSLVGLDQYRHD